MSVVRIPGSGVKTTPDQTLYRLVAKNPPTVPANLITECPNQPTNRLIYPAAARDITEQVIARYGVPMIPNMRKIPECLGTSVMYQRMESIIIPISTTCGKASCGIPPILSIPSQHQSRNERTIVAGGFLEWGLMFEIGSIQRLWKTQCRTRGVQGWIYSALGHSQQSSFQPNSRSVWWKLKLTRTVHTD